MNRRPSRFVVALARWALLAGLAGTVLAALAFIDRLRAPENLESQHTLLVLSAVLLSMSFVFAPFVRNAFGVTLPMQQKRERRKTLLDEMRERPEGEWLEAAQSAPPPEPPPERSVITRLILVTYGVYAAVLVVVLLALR